MSNYIQAQLNSICVFQFVLAVFLPIFFGILKYLLLRETPFFNFETQIVAKLNPFEFYVLSLNIFCNNYPYLIMATFDICALMHVLFIYWDINLVPAEVHVNNYDSIPKLGLVNNMFLSRSSMFCQQSSEVVSVHFGSSRYMTDQDLTM
jgi:hypothetical protein